MAKEKIKFAEMLKKNAIKIAYVFACFIVLTAAASALFFSTNIIHISDGSNSTVLLSTKHKQKDILNIVGMNLSEDDSVLYTSFEDNYRDLTIRHSFNIPITVDGNEYAIAVFQSTVEQALEYAGITLGEHDYTEPSLHTILTPGSSIRVYRVEYVDNQYEETVPHGTKYRQSSLLFKKKSKTYTLQDGEDGLNLVTYRERYVDGELELALESKVDVIKEPVSSLVLSYGAGVPVSNVSAPSGVTFVDGVPTGYSRVYSMSATGYYSAKGKGASRLGLYYGTVAVNPNYIPYGTKMYIASPDGKFVYGWAIATDTGTAMMENPMNIDLFYETYLESCLNGRIPVNVYIYG